MITTVDIPDALLKEVDLLVEKRRAQRSARPAAYKPTQPERHEAHRIAQEKGAAWANAYLKSLGPKREKVKASRGSVLIELAQSALHHRSADRRGAEEQPASCAEVSAVDTAGQAITAA